MSARASRSAVVVTASAFLFSGALAAGCVDEDPIVTGHRPDGGADAAVPIQTVVPGDDGPGDDLPDCRHCGETLSTDTARGILCAKNNVGGTGLSSVELLNALVDCVCYDKCTAKCTSYCSGSKNDLICSGCLTKECSEKLNACVGDTK